MRSFVVASLLCVAVCAENFVESFEDYSRWAKSADAKFEGSFSFGPAANAPTLEGDAPVDQTVMIVTDAAKHHAISAKFDSVVDPSETGIVVQYEVRFAKDHSCGGAYLKVLQEDPEFTPAGFKDNTPYIIMFGPDKCGTTDKVHFIFRHKNPKTGAYEEKHLNNPPTIKNDRLTHLYTLVVRPDETYEVLIDQKSVKTGKLHEDFSPPVNPQKEIDDPTDSKPGNWVDEAMMDDPKESKPADWDEAAPRTIDDDEAVKPAGWEDEGEEQIADPEAVKPEDWEDEDDGEWEAPLVDNPVCKNVGCGTWVRPTKTNPDYKGKWFHPQIENPEYKGEWRAAQIANPDFFEDAHPHALTPMGAVGVEIWTMQDGIEFDNVWIGTDAAAAAAYATETWGAKHAAEDAQRRSSEGGSELLSTVIKFLTENVIAVVVTLVVVVTGLVYLCCCGSSSEDPTVASVTRTEAVQDDEEEEDEDFVEAESEHGDGEEAEGEEEEEEEEEVEEVKVAPKATRRTTRSKKI